MKSILMILLLAFTGKATLAQCHVIQKQVNGITVTETDENYIYSRTAKQYHALSLKLSSQANSPKNLTLLARYTSSANTDHPKFISINLADRTSITLALKPVKLLKSDDKAVTINDYTALLGQQSLTRLDTAKINSFSVLSITKKKLVEIEAPEKKIMIDLIGCMKQQ